MPIPWTHPNTMQAWHMCVSFGVSRLILLLTDRPDKGERIGSSLGLVRPCRRVPIQAPSLGALPAAAIVSDVTLDSPLHVNALRAARARHPQAPMLCLLRDGRHCTRLQALAVPATATLRADASQADLIEAVRDLVGSGRARGGNAAPGSVQTCASLAGIALAEMMDTAAGDGTFSRQTLAVGADLVLEAVEQGSIRTWLDIVRDYDDTTYQHSLTVAGLAASFAARLGFGLADRRRLTQAALLHDVGKARLPLKVLNKPGPLTSEEVTLLRTHAAIGHAILVGQGGFEPEQLLVVRHHHEYLDGSGYPDGLAAGQVSDLVRLVTICDIYAALIERRSYKAPMPAKEAYSVVAGMGGKLDAELVAAFHDVAAFASA